MTYEFATHRWDLRPSQLITHRFPLETGFAYELMSSGRCGKVAVCFDEELSQPSLTK